MLGKVAIKHFGESLPECDLSAQHREAFSRLQLEPGYSVQDFVLSAHDFVFVCDPIALIDDAMSMAPFSTAVLMVITYAIYELSAVKREI